MKQRVRQARPHRLPDCRALPVAVALAVVGSAAAVAASGVTPTAGGSDQQNYHLPTVLKMAAEMPRPDVVDVMTATGPLLHLVLAILISAGAPLGVVQTASAAFAAALLAILTTAAARATTSSSVALLIVAPLGLSAYFWQSALWINTDDAAAAFGVAALLLLVASERRTDQAAFAAGVLIALAVLTRQTGVWLLAPAAIAVLLHAHTPRKRVLLLVAACGPGVIAVSALVLTWGGLTPPQFLDVSSATRSPAALCYAMALWAFLGTPLLVSLRAWRFADRRVWAVAAVLAGLSVLVGSIYPTTAEPLELRRYGGWLWTVTEWLPSFGTASPLLIVMASVGSASLVLILAVIAPRQRWILAVAVFSLVVVQSVGAQMYQRYFELPLAALLALTAICAARQGLHLMRWPLMVGAVLQFVLLSGVVLLPLGAQGG